jgi:hypothetical protein
VSAEIHPSAVSTASPTKTSSTRWLGGLSTAGCCREAEHDKEGLRKNG